MFKPTPTVQITGVHELQPGDVLILGKRHWIYQCRTEQMEQYAGQQNEWYFEQKDQGDGQSCDMHRVYTQSELEAFIESRMLNRPVFALVEISGSSKTRDQ